LFLCMGGANDQLREHLLGMIWIGLYSNLIIVEGLIL
jgi:hypothetical protein